MLQDICTANFRYGIHTLSLPVHLIYTGVSDISICMNAFSTSNLPIMHWYLHKTIDKQVMIECICSRGEDWSRCSVASCSLPWATRWLLDLSYLSSDLNFSKVNRCVIYAGISHGMCSFETSPTTLGLIKRAQFLLVPLILSHCLFHHHYACLISITYVRCNIPVFSLLPRITFYKFFHAIIWVILILFYLSFRMFLIKMFLFRNIH